FTSPHNLEVFCSWPPVPAAMRLPSGENATLWTSPVCPLRVWISCPERASHTFTSPGVSGGSPLLPATMRCPLGQNAMLQTPLVGPLRESSSRPECASHTFTLSSSPPEAIRLPSGENATLLTGPVCPLSVSRSAWHRR